MNRAVAVPLEEAARPPPRERVKRFMDYRVREDIRYRSTHDKRVSVHARTAFWVRLKRGSVAFELYARGLGLRFLGREGGKLVDRPGRYS